jgi:DNA-binding LacI/PurR family transcriptional regulator
MAKKVNSFDVARRAGVSQPTVSRALRNLPGTSPETREKVTRAARELAYIVSDSARTLSTTKTRRIAVVSEELTNPYYPALIEPLRQYLSTQGLRAVILPDTDHEEVTLEALADGSYDGVILTTTARDSTLPRDLTERGIAHVLVNRVLDHAESHSCTVDNVGGMAEVARLMAELGHNRIASIQGPLLTSTGRQRAEALRMSLRHHGLHLRRNMSRRSEFTHDASYSTAIKLLDQDDRPTAVVCGNDVIALGVLSAAATLGLDVPDDVTVIGFDDIPVAGWPLISLTTVHCDLNALASSTVELLMMEMANPGQTPQLRIVPVWLVRRGTHASLND